MNGANANPNSQSSNVQAKTAAQPLASVPQQRVPQQVPIDINIPAMSSFQPAYTYGPPHGFSFDPSMSLNLRNPNDVHGHSFGFYFPAVPAVPTADASQLPAAHAIYGHMNDQEWAEHVLSSMNKQRAAQVQQYQLNGMGVAAPTMVPAHAYGHRGTAASPTVDISQTNKAMDATGGVNAETQNSSMGGKANKPDATAPAGPPHQSLYYPQMNQLGQMGVGSFVPYAPAPQDASQAQLLTNMNVNHGLHSYLPPMPNYYPSFSGLGLNSVFAAPFVDQQNPQAFPTVYSSSAAVQSTGAIATASVAASPTTSSPPSVPSVVSAIQPAIVATDPTPGPSIAPNTSADVVVSASTSTPVQNVLADEVAEALDDLSLASSAHVPAPVAPSALPVDSTSIVSSPVEAAQPRKPFSYADALANPARKPLVPAPKPVVAPAVHSQPVPRSSSPRTSNTAAASTSYARASSSAAPQQRTSASTAPVARRPDPPGINPGPSGFNSAPSKVRCFVIKSYSADDIHKSIKYGVWASTEHGNRRLDGAYRESVASNVPVYLFFSVNGSGCFCGMAQMIGAVDYSKAFGAWAQSEKWPGQFRVKWIFIKNLPNREVRHVTLPNNSNKPVTNSRDTQEIPLEQALQVLKVFHSYRHKNSILDDFEYFDQEEEKRKQTATEPAAASATASPPAQATTTPITNGSSTVTAPAKRSEKSGGSQASASVN